VKPSLSVLSVLAITLLVAPGCRSSEPVAPNASEPLPVSVQTRTAAQSDLIPTIHASPSAGSVTIRVRGDVCDACECSRQPRSRRGRCRFPNISRSDS
jgi:hypothetical protein